jgi:hypothetical protein
VMDDWKNYDATDYEALADYYEHKEPIDAD